MKNTWLRIIALALILFAFAAQAETWYVSTPNGKSLNLRSLAELAGMSLSRFKHVFTATFNMSPGRYVSTIRLNAARELLETSELLVSDVATACGFYDQSHFTRAFLRERGVTPGAYRRRHAKA